MDAKVLLGNRGSFGFVSGLPDSLVISLPPQISHTCAAVDVDRRPSRRANFFQRAIVSLLAPLAPHQCRVLNRR